MSSPKAAPKLPIEIVNGTVDSFDISEVQEIVKQNVKMVVLTYPGERIMMPEFGVGMPRYLFEQAGSEIPAELKMIIRDQLKRYIPSINLLNVSVRSGFDDHKLNVSISYEIDFLSIKDRLDLLLEY